MTLICEHALRCPGFRRTCSSATTAAQLASACGGAACRLPPLLPGRAITLLPISCPCVLQHVSSHSSQRGAMGWTVTGTRASVAWLLVVRSRLPLSFTGGLHCLHSMLHCLWAPMAPCGGAAALHWRKLRQQGGSLLPPSCLCFAAVANLAAAVPDCSSGWTLLLCQLCMACYCQSPSQFAHVACCSERYGPAWLPKQAACC